MALFLIREVMVPQKELNIPTHSSLIANATSSTQSLLVPMLPRWLSSLSCIFSSLSITKISRTCTEKSTTTDRFPHASLESLLLTKLFPSVLRLRQLLDMETVIPKICVLMLFYLSLFRFILNIFSNLSLFTFCIYFQHMVATLLQTVFLAMAFTRMTGPNNVDQRVYVSKNALITLRNGKLYLTFR